MSGPPEDEPTLAPAEIMAATASMRRLFSARAGIAAMLRAEAALARAGAAAGLIAAEAATAIEAACAGEKPDPAALAEAGARAGTIVVPLVAWLRAAVPAHAAAIHRGGTTQDIVDTGLILQLRDGFLLLEADLDAAAAAAARLARAHAATPMIARTLLQPALPATFGLKAAQWLAALDDARAALRDAARQALRPQLGGAAGTLDGFGTRADAAATAFAAALGLDPAPLPWHTSRAPLARLAATLAAALGTAGKIATDTALMMQAECAEAAEPAAPGRGGSSAMAHKRNPTLAVAIRAAALRAPPLAATLLAALPQEHERAAGAWQAEQSVWPELMRLASGALAALAELLAGLTVDEAAMARNLAHAPAASPSPAIPALIEAALAAHARQDRRP
ncbi:lyase family protein [Acidiphilium sp.]|uniref:lyase family protein n=1 Tax=Acidiphilium sp. TaxID=527 RepID=UPI00258C3C8C|nr:lyase family protein [Acidiphilium sp.]